ncbi:MAG: sensor domain-containing diguanylate cyclase [Alphaproteobacteria bacterium]|nr:sensor domain-containing diguanylate cyclase [Alphaproteobacteria bacterium]
MKIICCEFKLRRSDGGFEWVEERCAVELDGDGKAVRFQGLLRIITSWKKREFELERMAFFDDLTGHLNRTRLQEALDEVLETCREDSATAAYLMVNIDRLGLLNDAYGFDIADAVIMDIGKRVEDCTSVGDIIGRAGGNQFGLILPGAGDVELRKVADQILTATRRREVTTEAGPLAVSLSLGGVLLPKDAANSRAVKGQAARAGSFCAAPSFCQPGRDPAQIPGHGRCGHAGHEGRPPDLCRATHRRCRHGRDAAL